MTNTASLRSLMIVLYKNDKSCAHQYMDSIRSGNITYRRTDQEARLKSAKVNPTRSSTSLDWKKSLLFKEVDVKYSDGRWYRGKITAYDEETDHYTVVTLMERQQPFNYLIQMSE